MILEVKDPENPNELVYIALRRCTYSSAWVPITPNEHHDEPIDAISACIEHLREVWTELQQRIEHVRTLCEHPEFSEQQMSPYILAKTVRNLENFVDAHTPEVELLDEPPHSEHAVCTHKDHQNDAIPTRPCRHQGGDAPNCSTESGLSR
jgi:hypothetical protein